MYRTDMAREVYLQSRNIPGVFEETEQEYGFELSRIRIESDEAAQQLKRPIGCYITLELPDRDEQTEATESRAVGYIASELQRLIAPLPSDGGILVLGLGNRMVTPDALGPRTADKVYATRHILTHVPEASPEGMRPVSVFAPGVLGTTGVETSEIIAGLIERIRPCALLCIDALASRRAERISASVQMSDAGIQPGAGVHNNRCGITQQEMGVPVFAVGVPTVVDALTIAGGTIELLLQETGVSDPNSVLSDLMQRFSDDALRNLIVTPKEIDMLIGQASRRLAEGINRALFADTYEDVRTLMQN